jgi:putative metallopeptidase
MPTTFEKCDIDVVQFAAGVLRKHHPELTEAGVTIDYAFASNPDDFAIKVRGQRALARVKIVSLEDRARGQADAKILIDESWWNDAPEPEREAVLDHEHEHLTLAKVWRDELTNELHWKSDDIGRPKLRMKHHDAELGIFFGVITRHQEQAADFKVTAKVAGEVRKLVQGKFWG